VSIKREKEGKSVNVEKAVTDYSAASGLALAIESIKAS